jgi:hypothetical protein
MIDEFPDKLSGKTKTPWNENLFKVDPNSKHLKMEQAKVFAPHVCDEKNVPLQVWMPRYSASHCLYGNKSYRTQ